MMEKNKRHEAGPACMRTRMTLLLVLFLTLLYAPRAMAGPLKVESASKKVSIYSRQALVTTKTKKLKLRALYNGVDVTSTAKWKSGKKSVVTVTGKGKLRIHGPGTANITCRYKGTKVTTRIVVVKNTGASGIPASKEAFIQEVASVAVQLYPYTRILPSVVIAQACVETGYGLGNDSVKLVKKNNLLGMKADLLNESWSEWSVWNGKTVTKKTPEYRDQKLIYIKDTFRAYPDYCTGIIDYEQFLMRVQYKGKYKYRKIRGKTSPKKVITKISRGGYATDPAYIGKVMSVILANNLTVYDRMVKK